MDVFIDRRWWLFKKYNTVWDKVSADIKKKFDSEPFYTKKKIKKSK